MKEKPRDSGAFLWVSQAGAHRHCSNIVPICSGISRRSDLPTHEEVLAAHLDADPECRREWERTALARAVAVKVIAYRAEHDLSQTALAKRLKMSQPAVARLESGEHNPTFPMLLRISDALGVELAIDIRLAATCRS